MTLCRVTENTIRKRNYEKEMLYLRSSLWKMIEFIGIMEKTNESVCTSVYLQYIHTRTHTWSCHYIDGIGATSF